jgi:hypothetical protein
MPQLGAIVGCGLAAALGGCRGTSANYPLDKHLVWRASQGEAMVWRPKIYQEQYRIVSERRDLAGNAYRYELKVRSNPNPFARRPSTRVTVIMEQTSPSRRRFVQLEEQFLQSLQAVLVQLTAQPES